jgi:hypothetical protein
VDLSGEGETQNEFNKDFSGRAPYPRQFVEMNPHEIGQKQVVDKEAALCGR